MKKLNGYKDYRPEDQQLNQILDGIKSRELRKFIQRLYVVFCIIVIGGIIFIGYFWINYESEGNRDFSYDSSQLFNSAADSLYTHSYQYDFHSSQKWQDELNTNQKYSDSMAFENQGLEYRGENLQEEEVKRNLRANNSKAPPENSLEVIEQGPEIHVYSSSKEQIEEDLADSAEQWVRRDTSDLSGSIDKSVNELDSSMEDFAVGQIEISQEERQSLDRFTSSSEIEDIEVISEDPPAKGIVSSSTKPLKISEIPPSFPGGEGAMFTFINHKLDYPRLAVDHEIQGTVFVEVVVNMDGTLSGLKVLRGLGFGCDEEALNVVGSMPKWKPGQQDGAIVPVRKIIPIKFRF